MRFEVVETFSVWAKFTFHQNTFFGEVMKKFSILIICCLMVFTCTLAGCASFSIDEVTYYNTVVAKVGDKNITRFDLLSAYSSYGYSTYVSNYGYSTDEALSLTLDLLISREVLYQYALDNEDKYGPTAYQVNSIVEDMFDSIDENMDDYIEEALTLIYPDETFVSISESEDEDDDDDIYKYTDYAAEYTKRATVVKNEIQVEDASGGYTTEYTYSIKYKSTSEPTAYSKLIDETYLNDYTQSGTVGAIVSAYYEHLLTLLENTYGSTKAADIYRKVRSLQAEDLISYEYYLRDENGKAYNTVTSDLIYRYFERYFESEIQSQYLENIRTYYLENEELSIELLIETFQKMVNISYEKYADDEDSYIDDIVDIGTDGDTILYHLKNLSDNSQFGYFVHTLFSFSDDQISKLAVLENNKSSMTDTEYQSAYMEIVKETVIYARDASTGVVDESQSYTLSQVMTEYSNIVSISNYSERLEEFIQFMFKYTGDTATLEAGMPYVVGTKDHSSMEDAFTDEAVRLITEESVGSMTPASLDYDDLCITSYGVHLLFYVEDVSAYDISYNSIGSVYISTENGDDNGAYNLYYKEINPLTHQTYFDYLFDLVYPVDSDEEYYTSNTGYSDYETNLLNEAKKTYSVTRYETKINSTSVS